MSKNHDQNDQTIKALTVSRDIQDFDLLIEDMENLLGEQWGDLSISDTIVFLDQPEAKNLDFIAIALSHQDEENIEAVQAVISHAKSKNVKVIIVADTLSPKTLHKLLKNGGDVFVPYPIPEDELKEAVENILSKPETIDIETMKQMYTNPLTEDGKVFALQGMAGGTGTSTIAINLAYEFSHPEKKHKPLKTLLIDLNLQFGSVATYLELERKASVSQLLQDIETMDDDSFKQALQKHSENLWVLTSPADIVPMELISSVDIEKLFKIARRHFDVVIIDMPTTVVSWTDAVLREADSFFALMQGDMRCTQNLIRLVNLLEAEKQPYSNIRYLLNRAPKFTDLNGKGRIKKLSETLGINIEMPFPDGGKQVHDSCDQGIPLGSCAPKNVFRREIQKLSRLLIEPKKLDKKAA